MKTTLLVWLFFLQTFCMEVFAQNGKVGINTADPTKSLDVKGDIRIRVIRDTLGNLKHLVVDDSGNVYKVIDDDFINDTCPAGFVSVNAEYCIEQNERPAATWWNAVVTCGALNAHLCKWDEWYFAATNAVPLGLINLTGAWEWVSDGGGGATVKFVGLTSIDESQTIVPYPANTYSFRCCKSK